MKKSVKIIEIGIALVICVVVGFVITAVMNEKSSSDNYFKYEIIDGKAKVTYIAAAKHVVEIPSEYEGCPVTEIDGAVLSLDGNDDILMIKIPATVEKIGDMAFHAATNLFRFSVDKDSKHFSTDGKGVLYSKDKSVLVQYPLGRIEGTYTAHKDTKIIGENSFYQANHIKKVVIPEGVTEIKKDAFSNIYSLNEIVLPESLEIIEDDAMDYVFNAEKLPANLKEIGKGVFAGYKGVNLEIPDGVISIGDKAFENCENLETVSIPASVETIESTAFDDCDKLVSFTVDPENEFLSSDEYGVVLDKAKTKLVCVPPTITEYFIPEGVTYIGQEFIEHKNIKCITIPSTVETIAEFAFFDCSVEILTFAENTKLETVSRGAFSDCSKLKEIILPEGVKIIGNEAFAYCNSVEKIKISDSVEKVGEDAFLKTAKTTEVTIPENIEEIGENAFGYYYSVPVEKEHNRGKIEGFKIYGAENSAAEAYAEANGFEFIAA